ncbi:MAG: hydrolase [Actinomycetota bacterium]|nr:hydrolase [Actinomycetota bacterium]MDQ3734218.1 hydrolase [Actinomycetota bacterium]
MGHTERRGQSLIDTRHGPARLLRSPARKPWTMLVLGHGAGGGADARELQWLASDLPRTGVEVVRIEQPWRVAGKKVAARPAVLDEGWWDAVTQLPNLTPMIVGGRSSGARVACRTARSVGATGCLALAFPLHPPWRPEQTRLPELQATGVPTLVVQGDRDQFGGPADFPDLPSWIRIVPLADADHEFARRKESGRGSAREELVGCVAAWLCETVQVL